MKKVLVSTILGLVTAASVYAQGHVNISNYLVSPYNQVVWAAGTPTVGNAAVNSSAILLQIWYGAGVVTDESSLLPGITFSLDTTGASKDYVPSGGTHGAGGYYLAQTQVLPTTGTYTFQIRASGNTAFGNIDTLSSRSILWQPTGIGSTALPASLDNNSIGLVVSVPEPSTFALAGLGSAALLIFRRRK
jgi:hypothetical protein